MPVSDPTEIQRLYHEAEKRGLTRDWVDSQLSAFGFELVHFMSTDVIDRYVDMLLEYGAENMAKRLSEWVDRSAQYWAERVKRETGKRIYYDYLVKRWRDYETGRFVTAPYKYLGI